jgi:DNA-binding transcriptional LysR family regulator
MNEIECIRTFVKIVEVGSFAEAARQTGIAKSVVTKRITQLEEHLELQLLQRSTRRLSVTDGGADFYVRATRILAELDQAKAAVSSTEWGLSGNFRVSCVSSFTAAYLADDLCEFQTEHPELKLELRQHDRFCDPVQEGFDVCLQPATSTSGSLEKVDVLPLRRLIVATPDYIKKHGLPLHPKDLKAHVFAHNHLIEPDCKIRLRAEGKVTTVPIEANILTNTVWMLRAAVLRGTHMAMMPAFFIEKELVAGKLVPILPGLRIQHAQLSAFYGRSPYVPMKVRIFINFLRRKHGNFPLWEQRIIKSCPELSGALGPEGNG